MIREVKVVIQQDAVRVMVEALHYIPAYTTTIGGKVNSVETYCPNCYMKVIFKDVVEEEADGEKHLDSGLVKCFACGHILRLTYDNKRGWRSTFFEVYEPEVTNQPEKYMGKFR